MLDSGLYFRDDFQFEIVYHKNLKKVDKSIKKYVKKHFNNKLKIGCFEIIAIDIFGGRTFTYFTATDLFKYDNFDRSYDHIDELFESYFLDDGLYNLYKDYIKAA